MKQFIIITSASLLVFLTGCGTERITDYQPASPSISEHMVQGSGVGVALDPFVESERTRQYFDIDAVANGIAILHVRVVNNTADQTFLVEKKDFQLSTDGGTNGLTGDGKKIERSEAVGDTVGLVGAAAVSLPLLFASMSMVSHSSEIQRNFTGKEMDDQTLSPGQSMEGFIYFTPIKKGEDWTRAAAVKINLTETKTQHSIELNIPLSH
jgi:hypothetical protein